MTLWLTSWTLILSLTIRECKLESHKFNCRFPCELWFEYCTRCCCGRDVMSENEETSVLTEVPDNECVSSSCLQSPCRCKCKYCDREFAYSSCVSCHVKTQHYTEKKSSSPYYCEECSELYVKSMDQCHVLTYRGSSFRGFSLTANILLLKNFLLRN